MTVPSGRLKAFAYVNADKAKVYRAVMRVFLEAKSRFGLQVRPDEVLATLRRRLAEPLEAQELESVLKQLCEWGNLEAHPDTTEVATVEEFYRPRYFYQLSEEGEAAERALVIYEDSVELPGELQTAALRDIRALLETLHGLRRSEGPDPGDVHRALKTLTGRFAELTDRAQSFIGSLQRTIDLHGIEVEAFLIYKATLIEYLERFVGEFVVTSHEIVDRLAALERAGVEPLLEAAARRDLTDAVSPSPQALEAARSAWRDRWRGLRGWFVSDGAGGVAQADVLRSRARAAIPALLDVVSGINDRRLTSSDRATDLRVLARWFAETDSEADAHRLWRTAFGLSPARHLRIDPQTLDRRDAEPVPASTSWLAAPPLEIAPRLRQTGVLVRRVKTAGVIDKSAEKAFLLETARAEAAQVAAAQGRLATGARTRLSKLGDLDPACFSMFLDLLGEALTNRFDDGRVEATSADGTLRIRLEPTNDAARASIVTRGGRLSGPDHYVTIERVLTPSSRRRR